MPAALAYRRILCDFRHRRKLKATLTPALSSRGRVLERGADPIEVRGKIFQWVEDDRHPREAEFRRDAPGLGSPGK